MNIDEMPAGPDMDALVACRVFKNKVNIEPNFSHTGYYYVNLDDDTLYLHVTDGFTGMIPEYSSYLGYASEVIDWLVERGDLFLESWSDREWFVCTHPLGYHLRTPQAADDGKKTGRMSLPLAICRLALKIALEDEK